MRDCVIVFGALGATAFGRTATVMRQWGHIMDRHNMDTQIVKRANSRLASRTRTFDPHFKRLDATLRSKLAGSIRCDLGRKGRRFSRTPESGASRRRP